VERVASPVDDGLEQLVPRPRRRRQAGDVAKEPELVELGALSCVSRVGFGRRHVDHDTSLGVDHRRNRCEGETGRLRNGAGRW